MKLSYDIDIYCNILRILIIIYIIKLRINNDCVFKSNYGKKLMID